MITIKEIITITRDDPRAKVFAEVLTEENGWTKEECTVSVTYTHIRWMGKEGENERKEV